MGRIADKRAARQQQSDLAQWEQTRSVLADGLQALDDIVAGNDRAGQAAGVMLKPGELVLSSGDAALVEMRSAGGSYQGGNQGVSIHVAKHVTYRVGASKGSYVPNPAHETVIDHGRWAVTDKRIVFMGASQTREWQYAKMIGRQTTPSGVVMVQVSNRQKPSGLVAGPATDFWIEIGSKIYSEGVAEVHRMLVESLAEHDAARPGQPAVSEAPLPSPSEPQLRLPPAGWYPDPERAAALRWWDGQQWTANIHQ